MKKSNSCFHLVNAKYLLYIIGLILISCQSENENEPDIPNSTQNKPHLNEDLEYGEISDIDGNTYKTIQIGSEFWMAENLKTTKFCNGDPIKNITNQNEWTQNVTQKLPSWVYYENDPTKNDPHGKFYNWYASVDVRNICPCGWKVPSLEDWELMINNLGSSSGGKMKTTSIGFWDSPNTGATNESGFSGLASGTRWEDGNFVLFGTVGGWWSSTSIDLSNSEVIALVNDNGEVNFGGAGNGQGLPIRCIKAF